jgi:radical SAM protein with 4Fe4S-binding SPASM domain
MPWHAITLSANGDIKPCCQFSNKGRKPNTEHDTIMENFNSERMQELRRDFLVGNQPSACNSCWEREELVGQSRRLWFQDKFMKYDADFLNNDLTLEAKIKKLPHQIPQPQFLQADINLSNVCNLKCRMCGAWASNSWFEEEIKLAHIDKKYEKSKKPVPLQQYDLEDLRNMLPHLKRVQRIDFKGGEPMMAKHHNQFLEWMIEEEMTNVNLFYTTNGTVVNPKILNLLSHFTNVSLCFSIEGTEDLYSYIRGGKYNIDQIENTIAQYNELPNVKIMFNVTLQNYNVLTLDKLHTLLHEWQDKYSRVDANSAFTTICNKPAYLSPLNVPDELRDVAVERLRDIPDFKKLVSSMEKRTFDPELWKVFVNFTRDVDKMRHEDILEVVPEFALYFNE